MTICSPSTGNITLGQYYLPRVNKPSCYPHTRAMIVYDIISGPLGSMSSVLVVSNMQYLLEGVFIITAHEETQQTGSGIPTSCVIALLPII